MLHLEQVLEIEMQLYGVITASNMDRIVVDIECFRISLACVHQKKSPLM